MRPSRTLPRCPVAGGWGRCAATKGRPPTASSAFADTFLVRFWSMRDALLAERSSSDGFYRNAIIIGRSFERGKDCYAIPGRVVDPARSILGCPGKAGLVVKTR